MLRLRGERVKVFAINEDFANAVLQYLITRPFVEVNHFVQGFQDLQTVEMFMEKKEQTGPKEPEDPGPRLVK
jgi:hypothetical protein